ncbi:hypothetical protein [Sphingomonas melonis]|uniref:hypothetical protein n=1 Tax=Sphingomonas melonis TaxID=152682 RepID=UPI000A6B8E77|nr:hypothetical protein [Sphingomonas melonis]
MHIELRKLKVVDALSEETTCYSAEIWIDGQRAFLASNRGHGAADDYHAVGSVTEQAVDAWLAANRPVSRLGDSVMPHCLEFEVAALITRIEEAKRLRRQCRTQDDTDSVLWRAQAPPLREGQRRATSCRYWPEAAPPGGTTIGPPFVSEPARSGMTPLKNCLRTVWRAERS